MSLLIGVVATSLIASGALAAPVDRIGVAPFAAAGRASNAAEKLTRREGAVFVANELVARLAKGPVDRLIRPEVFAVEPILDPRAEDVRKWAYNAAVDVIVVGRVTSTKRKNDFGVSGVEVVIRSGHSGAELARHDVTVKERAELDGAIDEIAAAIWTDLGHTDAPLAAVAVSEPESGDATKTRDGSRSESTGHGLDTQIAFAGFKSDAPIEIKAEEAEIVTRGEGRELVFQRNVLVRQDSVTLRSDRLEASYRKGESEPRRLVAKGHVQIEQGDRRASCDRAVYLREESRLTCRGQAELIQGCDIVRGESIEFDLAADQARVEGAASIVIRSQDANGSPCETRMGAL